MLREAGAPAGADLVPAATQQLLDDLAADGVQGTVLAAAARRRCATHPRREHRRSSPGRRHCGARASSSVPATVNAKSRSVRRRIPSPAGIRQLKQSPRSSICPAGSANRSRRNVRSTIVATHQPVIASLRSSNRPWLTRGVPGSVMPGSARRVARGPPARRRGRRPAAGHPPAAPRAGRRRRGRRRPRPRRPAIVDGASPARPASRAIDVESRPGIPHGSIRPKSARSTSTLSAMPW